MPDWFSPRLAAFIAVVFGGGLAATSIMLLQQFVYSDEFIIPAVCFRIDFLAGTGS